MKVWDHGVRWLHWTLVTAISVAWLSTLRLGFVQLHEPAGYIALGAVTARLVWGYIGSHYARLSQFVRSPSSTLHYARLLKRKQEPRYIGHNPLGGWMVVALLACVAGTGFTGWLFTTDMFWGTAGLAQLHSFLAWTLLVLIALHLIGVIFTSLRHRENLVRAMITGRKAPPHGDDLA
jgi:cytochrome b